MTFFAFRIKIPYPLQWGAPTFDAGHCFGMMAAVIVSMIEVLIQTRYKYLTDFTILHEIETKFKFFLPSLLEHIRLRHV